MVSKEEILFPHAEIREVQQDLINEVHKALADHAHLIASAPTGLGKTAATIPIALSYALKHNLTVFFLTSRHTQHKIAVDTIKQIVQKHKRKIVAADIIGKKWMCSQPGAETLYSNEFAEYCRNLREHDACEFYTRTKKKNGALTLDATRMLEELTQRSPDHTEDLIEICRQEKLCPYEMAALVGKQANIIIADYNYIFNKSIRNPFFLRTEKELSKSIIIVDEAHNLPKRARELMTARLSDMTLKRAIKEAAKFGFFEEGDMLQQLLSLLEDLAKDLGEVKTEKLLSKKEFSEKVPDYQEVITRLTFAGDEIREQQKQSYLASIAIFLESWLGQDNGFARILSRKQGSYEAIIELSYRCLDPSLITGEIINEAHSIILMSGTLTPTFMYKDVLGFNDVIEKTFKSPFPKNNRLSLIIPDTTTKYTRRTKEEFGKIAAIINTITNEIPGNSIVFFPSYQLRNNVFAFLEEKLGKPMLLEKRNLSKEDKQKLLEEFRSCKDEGTVLLAVTTGSFGEGVDLPGDELKGVIVVGLPLEKPSLEIQSLIEYYDQKFKKGWEYGYVYPAIIKVWQNAGRCIRSETDKGIIAFLDERYAWDTYHKCFPPDYDVKITKLYAEKIANFFK